MSGTASGPVVVLTGATQLRTQLGGGDHGVVQPAGSRLDRPGDLIAVVRATEPSRLTTRMPSGPAGRSVVDGVVGAVMASLESWPADGRHAAPRKARRSRKAESTRTRIPAITRPSHEATDQTPLHRAEAGRSSDSRARPTGRDMSVGPTGRRFPGTGPSADDGVRSHSPLRGSPGLTPGSLLRRPPWLGSRTSYTTTISGIDRLITTQM